MERCTVYNAHMSNQKRRVIYMTDKEWQHVLETAQRMGLSASSFVRKAVHQEPQNKQAERDAILRRIQKG